MTIRIQLRRDTAANWVSANPVLLVGELGFETDTLKFKLGNGNNWNTITSYANVTSSDLTSSLNDYILATDRGAASGVAALDSSKNLLVPGASIVVEGSTDNAFETTIVATDPTADRTITIPNASGTILLADGSGNVVVDGNLTVSGTTTTVNSTEINVQNSLKFEGLTDNAFETNLTVVDPTADRTVTFQDADGTVALITNVNNAATAAANDATTKANDAVATAATYTDGQINTLHTAVTGEISTHNLDTTAVHGISNTADLATKSYSDASSATAASAAQSAAESTAATNLTAHSNDTTGVHGIADTSLLATQAYADSAAATVSSQLTNLMPKAGGTFTGNITAPAIIASGQISAGSILIDGNLTVNGTSTSLNTLNISLRDNIIYLNESVDKAVTNAVGNGTHVTYTIDNSDGTFLAGNVAMVTGITPAGLNSVWSEITSTTSTSFTIAKTDTDTYSSGGTAYTKASVNPDLGFVGGYNDGTYAHSGLIKDASDNGKWKLFDGVVAEPGAAVDFTTYSRAPLEVGALFATGALIGDVTNIELQYVHGVTSAIQAQIDSKQSSVSGVSNIEIGYLDGVTSNIQTQIDAKTTASYVQEYSVPTLTTVSQKTSNYTISSVSEKDTMIEFNSTTDLTITIPPEVDVNFPNGSSIDILNTNTGLVTVVAGAGVTVNATPGLKLRTQWSSATLFKRGTNSWVVYGDLKA